ncbi:hypothetical protein BDW59DRAFT_167665 [Aspergillus cavernicola]|uniref:Pyrroline-5-carboxylate reductase n=1 Tax=Aspergillus cavernicola TaxID=176166 RepID=A0ABR4HBS6_9EURO
MSLSQRPIHLTFLGCGHIGKALLGALLPSISNPDSPIKGVTVALKHQESQTQLQSHFRNSLAHVNFVYQQNTKAVRNADAILFAFPPDQIHEVLGTPEIREALQHKLVISILARTPHDELKRVIQGNNNGPGDLRIARAMPTMGTEVHESATLLADLGNPREIEAVELAAWIFNSVGKVYRISDDYFDAATGMSAFSNALITVAIQAIARKAVSEGIREEHAIAIASQCIRGMVELILSGISPEELERSLSAPGSITGQAIEGLKESQMEGILGSLLSGAVARARDYT